jgi:tetratricopeptide (TPR) repeat protein
MGVCCHLRSSVSVWMYRRARFACSILPVAAVLLLQVGAQNGAPHGTGVSERATTQTENFAETDLQKGTDLTRRGQFKEAIPFLLSARTEAPGDYEAGFNLALCYLGVGEFKQAIDVLLDLHDSGHDTAAVNNLMAQAYVGDRQPQQAFRALQEASKLTPMDERLYSFVADACTDHYAYGLGLKVVDLGLVHLPGSARLHYERAVFLGRLDRLDEANPEFQLASKLAPGTDLAYLALIQERLYEDNPAEALALAREGIKAGHRDYQMLSLMGTVLMFAGASPGHPEFVEARGALEASVAEQPDYSTSQIALGKLYMMDGRLRDAAAHLEIGRRLEPQNPAVYKSLAEVYRALGEREKSKECLAALSALLQEKTATRAGEK